LGVVASRQPYEHVRTTVDGSIVRYVDRGLFAGFTAELELDRMDSSCATPELAERVADDPGLAIASASRESSLAAPRALRSGPSGFRPVVFGLWTSRSRVYHERSGRMRPRTRPGRQTA